jgi:hypothetical protein
MKPNIYTKIAARLCWKNDSISVIEFDNAYYKLLDEYRKFLCIDTLMILTEARNKFMLRSTKKELALFKLRIKDVKKITFTKGLKSIIVLGKDNKVLCNFKFKTNSYGIVILKELYKSFK